MLFRASDVCTPGRAKTNAADSQQCKEIFERSRVLREGRGWVGRSRVASWESLWSLLKASMFASLVVAFALSFGFVDVARFQHCCFVTLRDSGCRRSCSQHSVAHHVRGNFAVHRPHQHVHGTSSSTIATCFFWVEGCHQREGLALCTLLCASDHRVLCGRQPMCTPGLTGVVVAQPVVPGLAGVAGPQPQPVVQQPRPLTNGVQRGMSKVLASRPPVKGNAGRRVVGRGCVLGPTPCNRKAYFWKPNLQPMNSEYWDP